jgi:hypothetical protein
MRAHWPITAFAIAILALVLVRTANQQPVMVGGDSYDKCSKASELRFGGEPHISIQSGPGEILYHKVGEIPNPALNGQPADPAPVKGVFICEDAASWTGIVFVDQDAGNQDADCDVMTPSETREAYRGVGCRSGWIRTDHIVSLID